MNKRYELTEEQVRTLVQHAFEGGVSSVHTAYHLDDELECVLAALEPVPGLPAAISEGALLPWAAELVEVLGRPNFACASIAELLRFDGADIPRKAEHEQARVIHWLLNHYLQHGRAWRMLAEAELVRIGELARERKRNGLCGDGGPHQWPAGVDLCVRCRAPKPEGSSHA
jgi:hypothetical protein